METVSGRKGTIWILMLICSLEGIDCNIIYCSRYHVEQRSDFPQKLVHFLL